MTTQQKPPRKSKKKMAADLVAAATSPAEDVAGEPSPATNGTFHCIHNGAVYPACDACAAKMEAATSPATSPAEDLAGGGPAPRTSPAEDLVDVHQAEDLDQVEAVAVQDQKRRIPIAGFQSSLFGSPEERRRERQLERLRRELAKAQRDRDRCHEKLRRMFRRYDRLVTEAQGLERRLTRALGPQEG